MRLPERIMQCPMSMQKTVCIWAKHASDPQLVNKIVCELKKNTREKESEQFWMRSLVCRRIVFRRTGVCVQGASPLKGASSLAVCETTEVCTKNREAFSMTHPFASRLLLLSPDDLLNQRWEDNSDLIFFQKWWLGPVFSTPWHFHFLALKWLWSLFWCKGYHWAFEFHSPWILGSSVNFVRNY